jgi:hypothetical protein
MKRALAIAAVLLLGAPATALGADVRVTGVNGGTSMVSLGSMDEDVRDQTYSVGGSSRTVSGYSLESVLEEAKADPYNWQYLEIARPGGAPIILSDEQVFDNVFPDGPPVATDEGSATGFIRPASGQGGDTGEEVTASPLDVRLREGSVIEVSASTSTTKTKVGEAVDFSASVDKAPSGEELIYSWTFNDGSRDSGQAVTHSFDEAGSYNVTVSVRTATEDVGGSDAVRVNVGELNNGGPDREGGGKNKDENAPDGGAVNGGSGTGIGGYGTGAGGTGTGTGLGSGAVPGVAAQGATGQPTQRAPKEKETEPAAPSERVVGELLSASAPASESAEEGEAAGARTGTPTEESGFGVPGVVIGFLVVGGLLGIGAMKEIEFVPLERLREAVSR